MRILVAGGAGYIGSHTIVELYKKGHSVVCVDNLYNSKLKVIKNLEKIIGKIIPFYKVDCCNKKKLELVFKKENFDAIIMKIVSHLLKRVIILSVYLKLQIHMARLKL